MSGAASVARIEVNGVELPLVEDGTGTPVVFSHGSGSDARYWDPQREPFAARYRFVAYTRRFFGSAWTDADADNSQEAHAADLVGLIDRLGSGPAHVVGFSAAVALRAAIVRPDLFRTLTIVEPNVPWLLEGDEHGEAGLSWWQRENDRVRAEAMDDPVRRAVLWFELVNNRGPGAFAAEPAAFREMWIDNMTAVRPIPPQGSPLTCDGLRGIAVPTLAIGTEHGMPYSRLIVERLAACIPGCQLVVIPEATHFVSYQGPSWFNEVVLAFLARSDSAVA